MPTQNALVEDFDLDLQIEESSLTSELPVRSATVATATPTCPITHCEC
ncbi:FDLD family class I lanthipeptide [Kutzneria chonburiensis]|uniref:FDLD family class I lanthipeptide n=1 Tax=Kutzneria chonburiensis TaxID=1483604 RepID=A0ABV6MK91_9PSEU|nr:FDLD family class I lanthipeptide [Kutzneria chonburiensis]